MNKKIEEMATVLQKSIVYDGGYGWDDEQEVDCFETARNLINEGYGNIKQAIKGFSQKAISLIHRYLDSETDYTPSLTCSDVFDMLIKELYGE